MWYVNALKVNKYKSSMQVKHADLFRPQICQCSDPQSTASFFSSPLTLYTKLYDLSFSNPVSSSLLLNRISVFS